MKKFYPVLLPAICYFFALLFCYAAISKILDFENFQVQLAQSPLLSAYAGFVSYGIIIIELITAVLLCLSPTRLIGLYASLGLMVGFTIYIYLILNYSDFIPCSCGGILEKLGWTEHLIFNLACVALAIVGILLHDRQNKARIMRSVLFSGTIAIVSGLAVVVMFVSSEYIIKKDNNFTRRFLQHAVIEDKALDLGVNSFYFAGAYKDKIYLGNYTTPLYITEIDTAFKSRKMIKIDLDNSDHPFKSLLAKVNYPNVYLYDGTVPIIYQGDLYTGQAKTVSLKEAYFSQLIPLNNDRFVFRATSSKTNSQILGMMDLRKETRVTLFDHLLSKQQDGVFDMDGKLLVDDSNQEIIYVYYYRNQILVMDDSLQLKQKLHTIDTTTRARVPVKKTSDGATRMAAPPNRVNKIMATHRNVLFNESNLIGRHESRSNWKNGFIIDLYKTDQQAYIGSLYIHNRKRNTLSQLLATDHHLYILSGKELVRNRLAQAITRQFKTGKAENLAKE